MNGVDSQSMYLNACPLAHPISYVVCFIAANAILLRIHLGQKVSLSLNSAILQIPNHNKSSGSGEKCTIAKPRVEFVAFLLE